jgi:hypothetical protein
MTHRIYTAYCNEWGCLWQGSTTDHDEARRWRDEHIHGTSGVDIIGEDEED